jgi:hypothetical protein
MEAVTMNETEVKQDLKRLIKRDQIRVFRAKILYRAQFYKSIKEEVDDLYKKTLEAM